MSEERYDLQIEKTNSPVTIKTVLLKSSVVSDQYLSNKVEVSWQCQIT